MGSGMFTAGAKLSAHKPPEVAHWRDACPTSLSDHSVLN